MPTSPLSSRTAARVVVISPAQNGAPLPEMRPLSMTSPVSGRRSSAVGGNRAKTFPQRGEARGGCFGQNGKPPLSTRLRGGIGG